MRDGAQEAPDARRMVAMNATKTSTPSKTSNSSGLIRTTLLEVVTAVSEAADTDREVVAVIHHLLQSGRMRLIGEFTEKDFVAALA
jgi:hypothetical protein